MSYIHESMARAYTAERLELARQHRVRRKAALSRRQARREARPAEQD